jgi:cell volume regulation protein A
MEIIATLAVIAAIIILGFIAELIFRRYDIPDVLFLIGIGILISSYFGWADGEDLGSGIHLFTTFALIFILFQGALSINFKTLIRSLSQTLKVTVLSFFATTIIVFLIALSFGFSPLIALLMGTILGGTSSAVVIPLVKSVEIKEKYSTVLQLESALSDVLAIVGSITVLEILKSGEIVTSSIFRTLLSSFSLSIIVGFGIGIIWIMIQRKFEEQLSNAYMLTIAIVIGLYAFVESDFVQASGAISALTFGLVLGNSRSILRKKDTLNSDEKKQPLSVLSLSAKNFYSEISFFVKTFFFVYLGMLIDFSNSYIFMYGLVLTLGIYLIRPFIVNLSFRKEKMFSKERTLLEVMIPKGLAAAVLAGVAVQSQVLGTASELFSNMILSVVILSILLTSILVFLAEKNMFKGFLPFLSKDKPVEVQKTK